MATTYKLVLRKDMHKGAEQGARLYYAQAKSVGTSGMERLCSMIKMRSPGRATTLGNAYLPQDKYRSLPRI